MGGNSVDLVMNSKCNIIGFRYFHLQYMADTIIINTWVMITEIEINIA